MQITSFDLLPSQDIYNRWSYDFTETDAAHDGVKNLGLESHNFMLNGGTVFLTLQAWAVFAAFSTLLALISYYACEKKSRTRRCSLWIDRKLKWNLFFQLFYASQIEIFASLMI